MRKNLSPSLMIVVFLLMSLCAQASPPKEDTAQLTFSKTAVVRHKAPGKTYTVQPKDTLSSILIRIPGVRQKDFPRYYRIIKKLNPQLTNPDKLQAGQTLLLPGKPVPKSSNAPQVKTAAPDRSQSFSYLVKKGDKLTLILQSELKIAKSSPKLLRQVQSLNPAIKNINLIYAGQVILLPSGQMTAKQKTQTAQGSDIFDVSTDKALPQKPTPEKIIKDAPALTSREKLAVIRHIIKQLDGNMVASGKYYLPITQTEQITIDCSVMPVVELDKHTTLFLDFENRSGQALGRLIASRWSNHHLVKISEKDSLIDILIKIFNKTKVFEMQKAQNPVVIGSAPSLHVTLDWLIAKKSPAKKLGLRFVYDNNSLLPPAVVNYAQTHSFVITELSLEKGLVGKPAELYSLPPITVFSAASPKDFAFDLLSYLEISVEKDVDISIFDIQTDGFNLSIKADLVASRQGKKTLIFSRALPQQFIDILHKTGNELICLSPQDSPAKNTEKILRSFQIAFAQGYFTFTNPKIEQQPYSIAFSGTKIKSDRIAYIVDFDFNQNLRGLMREVWSAEIARY